MRSGDSCQLSQVQRSSATVVCGSSANSVVVPVDRPRAPRRLSRRGSCHKASAAKQSQNDERRADGSVVTHTTSPSSLRVAGTAPAPASPVQRRVVAEPCGSELGSRGSISAPAPGAGICRSGGGTPTTAPGPPSPQSHLLGVPACPRQHQHQRIAVAGIGVRTAEDARALHVRRHALVASPELLVGERLNGDA